MERIHFDTLPSTHTWAVENAHSLTHGTVVTCRHQTAGRGQRRNGWSTQPGLNLTFSMKVDMHAFPAMRQFAISQAFALAVADAVQRISGVQCSIKWPNDIYAGSGKLAGLLISHSLQGAAIEYSILSAGVNINQRQWPSGPVNPVSLTLLTGKEYSPDPLLTEITGLTLAYLPGCDSEATRSRYRDLMWRGHGRHPFYDTATGQRFTASVHAVEPDGHIILRLDSGHLRSYGFKEVQWLAQTPGNK